MKKALKLFGILSIALLFLASCDDDDDPKDNNVFVGTYEGAIGYTNGDESKSNDNGEVTVVKVGDKYNFRFSDGIPSIKDVEIEKGENKFEIDWTEGSIITIDESNLNIKMYKDGEAWTANCKRK
ncbi:hypothetical protein C7377_1457 [Balneicella halophila]|uniref:Lipoprotein n=1 Tax=Balneicella halophila TaxID=1537566 RepID=A0A7L4UP34_BALHA|nr:hypothetical protein [Balneicella halophila]PVX49823.1 hypothetical protein C7377_1457 [Balneicella halophila]